jgi:hypothetical protein
VSKQDKVAPRTPADLERKYNTSFSEILGVATDARDYAQEAKKEAEELKFQVGNGISAQFKLSVEEDDKKVFSLINGEATKIHFKSDSLLIESTYFTLQADGTVKIRKGDIGGCSFDGEGNLLVPVEFLSGKILAQQINADGIVAANVELSGKITATEGSFGDMTITSSGSIFSIPYTGYYFGSTANDTFFGNLTPDKINSPAYQNGYRAVLGLGMVGGTASVTDCVLLTNRDIQFGGDGAHDPIPWNELRKAMIGIKRMYPNWFD